MSIRTPLFVRWSFFIALVSTGLAVSGSAGAAGRVDWKGKTFKERDDKAWRLEVAIYLPRAPDVPHVPMKFEFQPEVYYERDMVDGDKLVEHKVPLDNRQALIESVDVGFLDSGSGKIESRTRFTFKLTRAHGYEAGEYKVTIHDARNDQAVGSPTTLIFDGENEVIDRRAMVFSGGEKKKKVDTPKADAGDKPSAEDEKTSADQHDKESAAPAADAAATGPEERSNEEPGTIKDKPGGCGCRLADTNQSSGAGAALAAFALASLALGRRRSSSAR